MTEDHHICMHRGCAEHASTGYAWCSFHVAAIDAAGHLDLGRANELGLRLRARPTELPPPPPPEPIFCSSCGRSLLGVRPILRDAAGDVRCRTCLGLGEDADRLLRAAERACQDADAREVLRRGGIEEL